MKRSFEEVTATVADGVPSSSTKKPAPEVDAADVSNSLLEFLAGYPYLKLIRTFAILLPY